MSRAGAWVTTTRSSEKAVAASIAEDYFHLKSGDTIRLGRFTCIPVAKPQPAASEALDDLAFGTRHVRCAAAQPLRNASSAKIPACRRGEAEQMRMRDFDELFFFCGSFRSGHRKIHGGSKSS